MGPLSAGRQRVRHAHHAQPAPQAAELAVEGGGRRPAVRAASRSPSAVLRSADGTSFEEIAYLDAPAVLGTCQTVLPSGPRAYLDEASTLDLPLLNPEDELDAVSEAAMLAGANAALVGDEIVGFRDAVLIGPGTDRLRVAKAAS